MNAFSSSEEITDTVKILTRLPIKTYWTTNYDGLLEEGLRNNNRKVDVKRSDVNLAINIYDRDAVVYKMHGDISSPEHAVITKDDYEMYGDTHSLFTTALKGDLVSKTFLFVGFSFEDPNLDHILSRIKILLGNSVREHYCLIKKICETEYQTETGLINELEYANDSTRQGLRIQDLKRYGIHTVLLESHDEIPLILKEIERIHLNKTIFVSGSISSYTEVWSKDKVNEFCYKLSKSLVQNNYRVSSGFGLGIGSSIINGALDEIYRTKYKHINEHLTLHPFPQISDGDLTLAERWTNNRHDIISDSGICIFLFGNKIIDGQLVIAEGLLEEFSIARKLNKIVIPVNGTGFAASEVYNQMKEDADQYKYLETYWERLESSNQEELINVILDIIKDNQ